MKKKKINTGARPWRGKDAQKSTKGGHPIAVKKRDSVKKNSSNRTAGANNYTFEIISREAILEYLEKQQQPVNLADLQNEFGYPRQSDEAEALRRRVSAMCRDAQLIRNRNGAYLPVQSSDLISGVVSANAAGYGFLATGDGEADVYLSAMQMRQVLHGDTVSAHISGIDNRGRREGRIIEVLERAHSQLVGRLSIEPGVVFVVPENHRIHMDILVAEAQLGGASHGDMVLVEITEQPSRKHPPVGRIVEVLGQHLQAGMEIDVALHSHSIPFQFPAAVDNETALLKNEPNKKDKQGRRDIRQLPLVTIDGADARDFDDAVYCERSENGWRLYVAIADVSHYVRPGSALDDEAQLRGTSVYFPERVVPMLPEVLSNGLCSINPDVERLCMLCVMSLDDKGKLKRTRFQRAVMRSHARLTYSQVAAIIEKGDGKLKEKYSELVPHLENLHALYKQLVKLREARGSIEFESQDTRFEFDDNRKIKSIVPVQRNVAHRMIEESMILANVAAAGFLLKRKLPALYRVHHGPTDDRLHDLRGFLALRGLSLDGGDRPDASDYAKLAREASLLPDSAIVHSVMLRSMQAAVYQPDNEGHFGLALQHYAHFTSPIRRYPDLLVHRAIAHALDGGSVADFQYDDARMVQFGESCSMTERRAEEASREVVSWLKCEFLQHRIGEEFDGTVAAVTSFGLFVQLNELLIDGLVHVSSFGFDYFHFDSSALTLTGERTGTRYGLGDKVRVRVVDVNLDERKIDFELLDVAIGGGRRKGKSSKNAKSEKRGKSSKGHTKSQSAKEEKGERKSEKKSEKKSRKRKRRNKAEKRAEDKSVGVEKATTRKPRSRRKTATSASTQAAEENTGPGSSNSASSNDSSRNQGLSGRRLADSGAAAKSTEKKAKPEARSKTKKKSKAKAKAKTNTKKNAKVKAKRKSKLKSKTKSRAGASAIDKPVVKKKKSAEPAKKRAARKRTAARRRNED